MLKKIIKIRSVGRFKDYSAKGGSELDLTENNIIFGPNTYGKSTLGAIFRSLREGSKGYIVGRKTFGASAPQEVELLFDNKKLSFSGEDWRLSDIVIFDNEFVAKNVFKDDGISKEHQAETYEALLGEEVRKRKNEIDEKINQKKIREEAQKNRKREYQFGDYLSFEGFFALKEDTEVDVKIEQKKAETIRLENREALKKLIGQTFLTRDFQGFEESMKKKLDVSIESKIREHVSLNWKDEKASLNFLHTGVGLQKEDGGCVFCGQELSSTAEALVSDYRKLFSEEYEKFKDDVKSKVDRFAGLDVHKELLQFDKYGLELSGLIDLNELLENKRLVDSLLQTKKEDLNISIALSEFQPYVSFQGAIKRLSVAISEFAKQAETAPKGVLELKKELKLLEITKERFSERNKKLCSDYEEASKELDGLKKDIAELDKAFELETCTLFDKHAGHINDFLAQMGSNFKVVEFNPKKNMTLKQPYFCDYHFKFQDALVLPTNKQNSSSPEPEDKPHFKNTLSESDRRSLAFAFFLSKLHNEPDLDQRIIVLDDPFSSFDENRKQKTTQLLRNIKSIDGKKPRQVIILTHEASFLVMAVAEFESSGVNIKSFKITHSESVGSALVVTDVYEEFGKEKFFRDMEAIRAAVNDSVKIEHAVSLVRPCLEHLLKRKYYFRLSRETLQKGSIYSYLTEIGEACPVADKILDLKAHVDMHDKNGIYNLTEPERLRKLKEFLEIAESI